MTTRDTYIASVKAALVAKVATNAANGNAQQETRGASGVNVGYTVQGGNFANYDSATRNANAALAAANLLAEMTKQVAIQAAKDTVRAAGDVHPL